MRKAPRTTAEWVQAALEIAQHGPRRPRIMLNQAPAPNELRAEAKTKMVSTSAGRYTQVVPGERILYAPNGEKIRVIETATGGNQIEHGDVLHAAIRPRSATAGAVSTPKEQE